MRKNFYELDCGDRFKLCEKTYNGLCVNGITFMKCESGVTIDDGLTEVNAVDLANGEFWTIGEIVEVEV